MKSKGDIVCWETVSLFRDTMFCIRKSKESKFLGIYP